MKDLMGQRFGRLIVVHSTKPNKWGNMQWLCQCDCGNIIEVAGGCLNGGTYRSCGCLKKETMQKRWEAMRKKNKYRIVDGHVVVWLTNSDKVMTCDIDDWERLRHLSWHLNENGYARNGYRYFHQEVCFAPSGLVVDHINRNTLDNRRCNLRIATKRENALNSSAGDRRRMTAPISSEDVGFSAKQLREMRGEYA